LLQITAVVLRGGRSLHALAASGFVRRMPDAADFSAVCRQRRTGDAGDSAARSIRHCRPCLLDHAIELHHYVTDQTITFDQLPFSHAHHVGGLASTAVTATPG
jgi:hypothetical protein